MAAHATATNVALGMPIIDFTMDFVINLTICKALVTLTILGLTYAYFYFKIKFLFWSSRGVRGPEPTVFFGNSLKKSKFLVPEVQLECVKKYGKIFGIYEGAKPSLVVCDEELIRLITTKDSEVFAKGGESGGFSDKDWRRVRTILTPMFTHVKMKRMFDIMDQCAKEATSALRRLNGSNVDLEEFFGKYSLDVIARCCFATTSNAYEDEENSFFAEVEKSMKPKNWLIVLKMVLPTKVFKFVAPFLQTRTKSEYLRRLLSRVIKERKEKEIKCDDFLQLLLDAELFEEDKFDGEFEHRNVFDRTKFKRTTLDDNEIEKLLMLFLNASYKPTAKLLTFFVYNLAINQDIQEHLRREIESLGEFTYDNVSSLEYLDAVLNETLRSFPPKTISYRETLEEYTLPGTDIILPKGTNVTLASYPVHMDAANFSEPERFDASRFSAANKDKVKPFTFLSFGSGSRNCIGRTFPLIEAKLLICHLIKNFAFSGISESIEPPVRLAPSLLLALKTLKVKISSFEK